MKFAKPAAIIFQANQEDFYKMTKIDNSKLKTYFFDDNNISLLQEKLIQTVYEKTFGQYLIEKQNKKDILQVMKSIFENYVIEPDTTIKTQLKELNNMVLEAIVPDIISDLKMYFSYLKRTFGRHEVMELPKNVSVSGRKTLPSSFNF